MKCIILNHLPETSSVHGNRTLIPPFTFKENTMRKIKNWLLFPMIALGFMTVAIPQVEAGGRGDGPIIYVKSQGLYFDSIIAANNYPANGPFQKIEIGSNGLEPDFGPGDERFAGGRWLLDLNRNGEMDDDDK